MYGRAPRTSTTVVSKFPRKTWGAAHVWTVDTRRSSPVFFEHLGTRLCQSDLQRKASDGYHRECSCYAQGLACQINMGIPEPSVQRCPHQQWSWGYSWIPQVYMAVLHTSLYAINVIAILTGLLRTFLGPFCFHCLSSLACNVTWSVLSLVLDKQIHIKEVFSVYASQGPSWVRHCLHIHIPRTYTRMT